MANQNEDPAAPSAQSVGNAFIQQYYLNLHKSPDVVHKFYGEPSVLSRPGPDGEIKSVTTLEEINEMILSLDYQNYHAQILTADAQFSHGDGVIVLVTGCLTGNNNDRRKFTQTFFLATQDNGYFVLNDIFRYIDEEIPNETSTIADGNSPSHTLTPTIDSSIAVDQPVLIETTSVEVENNDNGNQAGELVDNEKESNSVEVVFEETVQAEQNGYAGDVLVENSVVSNKNVASPITEAAVSNLQEDAPKKSFASVVNALNKNSAPFHVRAPLPKPVEQPRVSVVPEATAPVVNSAPEKNSDHPAKAYAIFVANLPMSATVEELDKIFKQFGPIKQDGIQVRSSKGTCFGFVEFESASSMQSALEASPIIFANRKLSIEERRGNNDRAKVPSGRSGYRNDNFRRGRDNYNGNRGYGRNEFEKRGEFSSRAKGNAGRNGDSYQKSYSNGGEKVARQPVNGQGGLS